MAIVKQPNVTFYEMDSNPAWTGEGSQIPVIIGTTGIAVEGEMKIQKFKSFSGVFKTVANGGLGVNLDNNPLLRFLKDFFEEAEKKRSDDAGIPYVYVINLGNAAVTPANPWTDAIALAKSKREIEAEVFVGLTGENRDIISIIEAAHQSIIEDAKHGNPRIAYYTVEGGDDTKIKSLTNEEGTSGTFTQKTRIGLIEPKCFGKTIAKICYTPYWEEPGYTNFRTINPGTFNKRTPEQELELQNSGIIFITDELTRKEIHPKINLGVSTAFASSVDTRPNDCLLHSRRNTDNLIRRIYDVCYTQLKRNETETNLSFLKTDIDKIVDEEIDSGYMMKGTQCFVKESNSNPYNLEVEGTAIPVNSTISIGFGMYVSKPNVKGKEE